MNFNEKQIIGLTLLTLKDLCESESDSEEEDDFLFIKLLCKKRAVNPIPRHFFNLWLMNLSDLEFKKNFRMFRETFDFVLNQIFDNTKSQRSSGKQRLSATLQLLIGLWFFANSNSYIELSNRFHVSICCAVKSVRRVMHALCLIRQNFIHWPDNPEVNVEAFKNLHGFPGVVGIIDGTHISIPLYADGRYYINRKNNASIQVQVITDHTLKFIHVYAGQVGSVHDARVLRLSGVQEICNDDDFFPNNSHLIGDSAYPNQKHLLVPYKNNGHLKNAQRHYNKALSSTRVMVERSIGLLKNRWRKILLKLPMISIDLIPYFVMACCVLHNICIVRHDVHDVIQNRRPNNVHIRQYTNLTAAVRRAGLLKRLEIVQQLQQQL